MFVNEGRSVDLSQAFIKNKTNPKSGMESIVSFLSEEKTKIIKYMNYMIKYQIICYKITSCLCSIFLGLRIIDHCHYRIMRIEASFEHVDRNKDHRDGTHNNDI